MFGQTVTNDLLQQLNDQKENCELNMVIKAKPPIPYKEITETKLNKEQVTRVIRQRSRRGNITLKPLGNKTLNSTQASQGTRDKSFEKMSKRERYENLIPIEGWKVDKSPRNSLFDIF